MEKQDHFDFEYCAAPTSFRTFVSENWEREPLIIHRNDPKYFEGLFSLSDIDAYLHMVKFDKDPNTILISNHQNRPHKDKIYGPSRLVETHLVMSAYDQGDSFVFNRMERFWFPLTRMCRSWESLFRYPITLHSYLTPPDSQGFPPHFEGVEVCVLQLQGSKTWKIYPSEMTSALVSQEVERSKLGLPCKEVAMHPGDFLYIPSGFIHEGVGSSEGSLHLSALIHVYRWIDLIYATIKSAAQSEKTLRQAIQPGALLNSDSTEVIAKTFEKLVRNLPDLLHYQRGLKTIEKEFLMAQQPLPDSRFRFLSQLDTVTVETMVFRHSGTLCSVFSDCDKAEIAFCRNFVRGPLKLLPAFEFIASHSEFKVSDLPEPLDDRSKVVLVRRLIKEGLLGISQLDR